MITFLPVTRRHDYAPKSIVIVTLDVTDTNVVIRNHYARRTISHDFALRLLMLKVVYEPALQTKVEVQDS